MSERQLIISRRFYKAVRKIAEEIEEARGITAGLEYHRDVNVSLDRLQTYSSNLNELVENTREYIANTRVIVLNDVMIAFEHTDGKLRVAYLV